MSRILLFTIIISVVFFGVACSQISSDTNNEKQANHHTYDKLVDQKNEETDLEPLQLTRYADEVGASISAPLYQSFTADQQTVISGNIEKHQELKGSFAWVKMKQTDPITENDSFEYYVPINDGAFEQVIHFFNGAGVYHVQMMLPSMEKENYYTELASFEVTNLNPEAKRDITYTPIGIEAGIHIANPGFVEENEMITIQGELETEDRVMIQIKQDTHSWEHVIPVNNGAFVYDVPLFFAKGIHEIHVLIPDHTSDHRFQYASMLLANKLADYKMEPIEYYRDYETRGIQLETPRYGGTDAELTIQISGNIDPEAEFARETTHLYVKTKKGDDEALDIIPVTNYQFNDSVFLRFGPGQYEVSVNVPKLDDDNKAYFSYSSVADFSITNTDQRDERDLLPSRGIQSQAPEIVELAKQLTNGMTGAREKAKAIYDFTAKNVAYDVEKFHTSNFAWDDSALKTLELKKGVCQDYAYLAAALLRASGIEARFVAGKAGTGPLKENHAWIEANIDDEWLTMDPTWGSGYIQNDAFVASYTEDYFAPDQAEFSKTHIREKPEY
ncbi:transglutaminase-like domain-containing protein [Bacillus sp. FJAT-50079]|uniref:transglutaminase domain-containing protein n=1 Tax=Bacillus sp. FJAT-50079 TaxID=2833577 RepID=UPI001BC8E71B|nr:transglutaminase-like domain-containing protein [Bacillus sp. FJAT-50079]MBS4209916.1 transglutaminase domain-containing protein [Bacillus sp. FJAT-50079]